MTTTINNMIPINNKYILACEYKPKIYIQNLHLTDKIDNEKLYLINTENNEYEEILLKDYPENIPFHPQSMSLYIKNAVSGADLRSIRNRFQNRHRDIPVILFVSAAQP